MTRTSRIPLALATLLAGAPPALSAETVARGIMYGSDLGPVAQHLRREIRCGQNQALVGLGPTYTDRMVGLWYRCAGYDPNGRWATDSVVTTFGPGQVRRGISRWHDCPRDYYIVGLAGTGGSYSGGGIPGIARVTPAPILADVQPLCRLPRGEPDFYQTQRSYFEQAHDNALYDIPARRPGDPRACPSSQVAIGILFRVDFRRDVDPESQFQDAALICDRLNVVIDRGLDRVRPH